MHGTVAGRPSLDLEAEAKTQALVRDAIGQGLIKSAHDVSEGGLAVAVAESCVIGSIGATLDLDLPGDARIDAALFGEAPARILSPPLRPVSWKLSVPCAMSAECQCAR